MKFEELFIYDHKENEYLLKNDYQPIFKGILNPDETYGSFIPEDLDLADVIVVSIELTPFANRVSQRARLRKKDTDMYCTVNSVLETKNTQLLRMYFEAYKTFNDKVLDQLTEEQRLIWELS